MTDAAKLIMHYMSVIFRLLHNAKVDKTVGFNTIAIDLQTGGTMNWPKILECYFDPQICSCMTGLIFSQKYTSITA